jgi:hypothetical protein
MESPFLTARNERLNLFRNKITFKAAGANFQGNSCPAGIGFYLLQIWFPGTAGMIFRMTHRITGNRMFSANIADP